MKNFLVINIRFTNQYLIGWYDTYMLGHVWIRSPSLSDQPYWEIPK